jgi:hypothetical protein
MSMAKRDLVEVVSLHAENLMHDLDLTDELLAPEPVERREVLEPMMRLARQVKVALPPVEPPREFVAQLRAKLIRQSRRTHALASLKREEDRRRLLWVAAGLGGLVYFTGMAIVSVRLTLAVLSVVAGLLGWKMVRPAAQSKQRTAP